MHTPRRSLVALGMSALLLVGGCNGDSKSSDEPTKTFSPTATQTPPEPTSSYTPPEPAKPPKGGWPEDKPVTEISAEEVARIWVKELSKSSESGDTSRLRHLTTPKCSQCTSFADDLDEDFVRGVVVKYRGNAYVPGELLHVYGKSSRHIEIALKVKAAGGTRREPSREESSFAAQHFKWYFVLTMKGQRWRIIEMEFLE